MSRPASAPGQAVTEINLLRYVPVDSPVHRLWAGTKIVALVAIGVAVSEKPHWYGELVVAGVVVVAAVLARVPIGAVPRFPRWFWIGVGLTAVIAGFSGGKPNLHLGGLTVGVGGLDEWGRLTFLVLLLLGLSSVLGWTTRMADLAPALSTLMAPLRLVRLPVDEIIVTSALAVRCLPLLVDEMRILHAARRARQPETPEKLREIASTLHDILVTALVSAVRRAQEMADAIEARGGVGSVIASRPRLRPAEVLTWLVTAVVTAAVVLL
ncbi:MAG TPA: energy-coupling factor transporter transmembrane protein EcfT [Acidimicrobiales bacterium]|nr:energy-coupling factor transporter transmembrane protein EcfT [Acidimicrobiales bacterium]